MSNQIKLQDPYEAIRIRSFRHFIQGRFCFIMALRMTGSLVGWWIYSLTNAPFAIGLVGLSEVIPALSLALYAGHVIDLSEKRGLLLKGVLLYFLAVLLLIGLSTPYLLSLAKAPLIAIGVYLVVFFMGVIRPFAGPTFNVMLASLVPKSSLQNATTWSQGTWLFASVTGHALGGLLIAWIGNTGTLVFIGLNIVIAYLFLYKLPNKPPEPVIVEKRTWESIQEGIKFVLETKVLLGALSLDLFAILFGGAVAMVPVFARDILHVGPQGFGLLNAAADIGSICMVVLLTYFPLRKHQGKRLLFAVGGFGICIIVFALSKLFWLSFAALAISGMLDGVSVVIRGTILQLSTPSHLRGRVMSVNAMFINSSNELGQFESGVAAKLLGVIPSVVFGGCITLLVVLTTWIKAPSLKEMEY